MKARPFAQKIYPTAVVTYDEETTKTFNFEKKIYTNCEAVLCDSLDKAIASVSRSLTNAC